MGNQYASLLGSFLKVGLFGFGGGYAMLPLITDEVVNVKGWVSSAEFADMVALSQMTPGPVALNAATYLGYTVTGVVGSVIATFAVCLPPFIIMYTVCRFFMAMKDNSRVAGAMRLLRPAVVGLVLAAALLLMNRYNFTDWKSFIIFLIAFALTAFWRVHPILVLVGVGIVGWACY